MEAAKAFGGGPVGSRALGCLRIEKGYGSWGREYSPEYWPQEVGLAGLIKLDKDFLNKDAYLALKDNPPREMLTSFSIEVTDDADATGGEPIFLPDGTPIGRVTSGAYGASVGMSLALGFVKTGTVNPGDTVEVFVLGKPHKGTVLGAAPFDPEGQRLRS